MRWEEGDFTFTDSLDVSVQGRERLAHVMTVKGRQGVPPLAALGSRPTDGGATT